MSKDFEPRPGDEPLWTPWAPAHDRVDVHLRNGTVEMNKPVRLTGWDVTGGPLDVIEWRPAAQRGEPAAAPTPAPRADKLQVQYRTGHGGTKIGTVEGWVYGQAGNCAVILCDDRHTFITRSIGDIEAV